jgi:hypothetical protein
MPVTLYSRYRQLPLLEIPHARRGLTRSLPIRRAPSPQPRPGASRAHRFKGYETADWLALKYFGREDLYWHIMDVNGGRLPNDLEPGEVVQIPPLTLATRVDRPGVR